MVNDWRLEHVFLLDNVVSAARASVLLICLLVSSMVLVVSPVAAQQDGNSAQQDLAFWEELAFWETVKDSQNPQEFEAYLLLYPDGRFAPLARVRIQALQDQRGVEVPVGGTESSTGQSNNTAAQAPVESDSTYRDCDDCPLLTVIPAGEFTMGSEQHRREEQPPHPVTISTPFALGVYEVTLGEWDVCVREGGCRFNPEPGDPALPVSNLSWDDAQAYVRWLSDKTGFEYRLPSEAEWEYAARAGSDTVFWWGDEVGQNRANCKDCGSQWSGKGPAPVGSFEPNPFGVYDVHGNLWEWTADCWNSTYKNAPDDGSVWTKGDCIARVLRGGAWLLEADYMRSARRSHYDRDVRYYLNGFRVAKTLP